jgi:hypothetical protein
MRKTMTSDSTVDFYEKWRHDEAHTWTIIDYVQDKLEEVFEAGGTLEEAYYAVTESVLKSPIHNALAYYSVLMVSLAMERISEGAAEDASTSDLDEA